MMIAIRFFGSFTEDQMQQVEALLFEIYPFARWYCNENLGHYSCYCDYMTRSGKTFDEFISNLEYWKKENSRSV